MNTKTAEQIAEVVEHARRRPGMYGLSTHGEATSWIYGIDVGTGLFPGREMTEWLHSDGDAKWGGRGGAGWDYRVARVALWGQLDPPAGQPVDFTPADEAIMRNAVLDFALAWLREPAGSSDQVEPGAP
ncbi:hypothetical protein KSP35_05425 [Aquihabitans sp. G128]|uniref:hypothetical protein n=1 Tax=Aquihabitans sp. G128 TaxID=2849779 RepID=UPI001C214FA6|nr:hypothetical protein [Aquihabitans sp. G128]QXC62249.1 hypothetical protein KSP35_05425 [Aquihabitans sp. G128]